MCVFGVADLPLLSTRKQLFANKFHHGYQQAAYDCMEEWHYARTAQQIKHGLSFNTSYYRDMDTVRSHVT